MLVHREANGATGEGGYYVLVTEWQPGPHPKEPASEALFVRHQAAAGGAHTVVGSVSRAGGLSPTGASVPHIVPGVSLKLPITGVESGDTV